MVAVICTLPLYADPLSLRMWSVPAMRYPIPPNFYLALLVAIAVSHLTIYIVSSIASGRYPAGWFQLLTRYAAVAAIMEVWQIWL